jgi:hypothetical protein
MRTKSQVAGLRLATKFMGSVQALKDNRICYARLTYCDHRAVGLIQKIAG